MKICFPVQQDEGLGSTVFNHFGSAPAFVVVDTDSNSVATISNRDQHHVHGACNPMKALDNQKVDAVVVGGIGAGALTRLNQLGIKVYRAQSPKITENIELIAERKLPELTVQGCCGGHGSADGCAHH
jgi:predicted Fe-Mo cluster-binding NifX family protein